MYFQHYKLRNITTNVILVYMYLKKIMFLYIISTPWYLPQEVWIGSDR
jgi:hypothetical protein